MRFGFLKPIVRGLLRYQVAGAASVEETADMLLFRMWVMPPYLSWPMVVLTVSFDLVAVFSGGRRFRSQSTDAQARYIQSWKKSPLGIAKDFIQFYEKMGTFIYFAQQEEKAER